MSRRFTKDDENKRDKAVLAFFASLAVLALSEAKNASTASEAKNVPPIGDRRGFLTPSKGFSNEN